MSRPALPELRRMQQILQREQRALNAADMPALMKLAPRKAALLERLESADPAGPALARAVRQLRDQARRNARLFEAALRGLTDAQALVRRLSVDADDQTYHRDGRRQKVNPPGRSFERRA